MLRLNLVQFLNGHVEDFYQGAHALSLKWIGAKMASHAGLSLHARVSFSRSL